MKRRHIINNVEADIDDFNNSTDILNDISHFETDEEQASSSELHPANWEANCQILPRLTNMKHLLGCHLIPTCAKHPLSCPQKKVKVIPEMRCQLHDEKFFNELKMYWLNNKTLTKNDVELITSPFKVCVIDSFIENSLMLKDIVEEFNEVDWNLRNTDLYEFFQSEDLKHNTLDCINKIYEFLKNEVLKWVADFMDVELVDISATCSFYSNTDYLLVHDDQREDRLVAFVLYFTGEAGWDSDKGGALQLFACDSDGYPTKPVRDILPANNRLVLFPVTSNSHHQVAEVITREDCRLSINGWFHTKVPPKFNIPHPLKPLEGLYSVKNYKAQKSDDIDLDCWISQDYLNSEAYSIINEQIENNSEISLRSFFRDEPYQDICQILTNTELNWNRVGPPNKYCYDVLDHKDLPFTLSRCLKLFQSEDMFSLLRHYTDLDLITTKASMKYEFQRWRTGYYALLTDFDWGEKNELDLIMYFGVSDRSDVIGGQTQYVTIDDEVQTALVTIEPEDNNLNIVYRDTARFTKYISKQSRCKEFYTLICSYAE